MKHRNDVPPGSLVWGRVPRISHRLLSVMLLGVWALAAAPGHAGPVGADGLAVEEASTPRGTEEPPAPSVDGPSADGPSADGPSADEPAAEGLSDDELARRREALEAWTFEPVALDGTNCRLLLDRRNARFVLRDLRTGVKWYSAWGRKGFASVRLKSDRDSAAASAVSREPGSREQGSEEQGSQEQGGEWVPLDQVQRLVAEEKRIRFSLLSSIRKVPPVDFVLELLPGGSGVRLTYEVPPSSRARIQAVRLLDDCLWLSDADTGGIALARGLGEMLEAEVREPVRRRLRGTPLLRPAWDPDSEPASLFCVGLLKGKNPLLVRWTETFQAVEVERTPVSDASFPGTYGLFLSVESTLPRGEVDVYTLGSGELGPVDVMRGYREVLTSKLHTLRYKTNAEERHRSFVGAPFFRPAVGATDGARLSFSDIATFATRLEEKLDIDRAAFIVRDGIYLKQGDKSQPPTWSGPVAAGGDEGLAACARKLRELGYLFGIEVPMSLLDEHAVLAEKALLESGTASGEDGERVAAFVGPPEIEAAAIWARRTSVLEESQQLVALDDALELDMFFAEESPVRLGEHDARPVIEARARFYRHVERSSRLLGVSPGTEHDVERGVYLGGYFDDAENAWPAKEKYPLVPAAFSHCVRFGRSAAAPLQADDPKGFLFHLILGEVPLYATPGASEDWRRPAREKDATDPRAVYARDAGWAAGKGLSAYEVFLRNTYEVLSHVARYRAQSMMLFHRRLSPNGSVRETYFGQDMRIVVNFGDTDYEDEEDDFILPPFGFYVRYPFLLAFHALRVNDHHYDRPVFYVVRSLEGKMIFRASRVNMYRGFGPSTLHLAGKRFKVERQIVTKIW